ncbi:MAG: DeoR/GlpR family DNA-binding transcription regulator [Alphaproteobacteria bacterium]|jgi:DeoR/GlpR family transcriptional regulator of sugar metabolism|nr:DeoR/GlpR family DNA-binding transcription regulator [Alphaproteobacteria bacterium]
MLPEKRRQEIVRLNKEKQGISIKELADFFKVSNMTVLRDIKLLEKQGKLEIVRGGVIPIGSDVDGSSLSSNIYDKKRQTALSEKQQIGKYCAEHLIKEGSIIALEGGSTAGSIIKFLSNKQKITIMTNGLFVIKEASEKLDATCRIIGSGGLLERPYLMFLGPDVEQFFSSKHTDIAFVSCVGFDYNVGPMDSDPLDIQAKIAIFKNAERKVLVIDKSKFNVKSVLKSVAIENVTDIVTNSSVDPEVLENLKKFKHITVHLA